MAHQGPRSPAVAAWASILVALQGADVCRPRVRRNLKNRFVLETCCYELRLPTFIPLLIVWLLHTATSKHDNGGRTHPAVLGQELTAWEVSAHADAEELLHWIVKTLQACDSLRECLPEKSALNKNVLKPLRHEARTQLYSVDYLDSSNGSKNNN